jgi:O-antigen ligase
MDRDVGLSGRTELWGILFDMILWRPWLGYGYGGFWLGWEGASSSVWLSTGWDMLHAHNGFIDICLDLGVLGLTILLVGFWRNLVRAISFAQTAILEEELWPLIFLTFLFLYNFTESVFLVQHSIFWMFYVSLSFSMIYRSQFFYVGRDATVRDEQHRREYLAEAHHPYLS